MTYLFFRNVGGQDDLTISTDIKNIIFLRDTHLTPLGLLVWILIYRPKRNKNSGQLQDFQANSLAALTQLLDEGSTPESHPFGAPGNLRNLGASYKTEPERSSFFI